MRRFFHNQRVYWGRPGRRQHGRYITTATIYGQEQAIVMPDRTNGGMGRLVYLDAALLDSTEHVIDVAPVMVLSGVVI
jgi:hypothetical protein